MKQHMKFFATVLICLLNVFSAFGQLSDARMSQIAQLKLDRFQSVLDLNAAQEIQFKEETINLLKRQSLIGVGPNYTKKIKANIDQYYASLTKLKPDQLATLKLFDASERQARKDIYSQILESYNNPEFSAAISAYNWNIVMPILVSYRQDLEKHLNSSEKKAVAALRSKFIAKYNFIESVQTSEEFNETEKDAILSRMQAEILKDIADPELSRMVKKYDEKLIEIRRLLSKEEKRINADIQAIYREYLSDDLYRNINSENELLASLGISSILKDSFFFLLDPANRMNSFKVNTIHMAATGLFLHNQF